MRIDFPQLGNGQFVEILDPKKMSWRAQKELTAAMKDESIAAQLEVAELIAVALIKKGYVLDAHDEPVTFPLTEESLVRVPAIVIEEVAKKFAEVRSEATSKN